MKTFFGYEYKKEEILALRKADKISIENRLAGSSINPYARELLEVQLEKVKEEIASILNDNKYLGKHY